MQNMYKCNDSVLQDNGQIVFNPIEPYSIQQFLASWNGRDKTFFYRYLFSRKMMIKIWQSRRHCPLTFYLRASIHGWLILLSCTV